MLMVYANARMDLLVMTAPRKFALTLIAGVMASVKTMAPATALLVGVEQLATLPHVKRTTFAVEMDNALTVHASVVTGGLDPPALFRLVPTLAITTVSVSTDTVNVTLGGAVKLATKLNVPTNAPIMARATRP